MNSSQISEIFSEIQLSRLAFVEKFHIHHQAKIPVTQFLLSFFETVDTGLFSWVGWAKYLSLRVEDVCSENGIRQKLSSRHVAFFQHLFFRIVHFCYHFRVPASPKIKGPWPHIWVTDSSCIPLPYSMSGQFPGPRSSRGECATAKFQVTMDLKTDKIGLVEIRAFRDNDQSYSPDIHRIANKDDLVIRDLGYSVCSVFEKLASNSVFFISRLKYGVNLYDSEGDKFNLLSFLRKAFANGAHKVDIRLFMSKTKIPVRVTVFRHSEQQYQILRERRQKDRHQKAAHDEDYYEQLRYSVFITNIDGQVASAKTIRDLYRLRWRIEILYKCWKSNLNLDKIFTNLRSPDPAMCWILLYLALIKAVLYHFETLQINWKYFGTNPHTNREPSMLKIYKLLVLSLVSNEG